MTVLESVQKDFAIINKASGEFLGKLPGTEIIRGITLSAEMAGLLLLRETKVKIPATSPGTVILGAISEDAYKPIHQFIFVWAKSSGLNPKEVDMGTIPDDNKKYLQELTRFEQPFYEICQQNGIKREHFPFVATLSALKLVLAGEKMGKLKANIGLAIILFHLVAGSKTFPYPLVAQS